MLIIAISNYRRGIVLCSISRNVPLNRNIIVVAYYSNMVQKHIVISMIAPVAVAGILIMTILAATANAQQPVVGCGPGTDNSTCSTTPNQQQAPTAPTTAGCGPGTDNSTCSTTPNQQQAPTAPTTAGCGPGTDNSTCSTTPNQQQAPAAPTTAGCGP